MKHTLTRCHNVADLRRLARRRLPAPIFDYIDGGADDELTLQRNRSAFADYEILPEVLTDVSILETSASLFGRSIAWPLMLSPTGLTRMFHTGAETEVGMAASDHGLPYALSTLGTTRVEDFALLGEGPKLFQVYIFRDRGLTAELVARAKDAGYAALILTVDTPVAGNRERDLRNGLSIPPRLTLRSIASFASHPAWSLPALFGSQFEFVNVSHRADGAQRGASALATYINRQFDPSISWRDLEWLASQWGGPLAVKGVVTPADCLRARDAGASAVMLSNHGGRQLDGSPAPLHQIAAVREVAGSSLEIICDGGVRRGSDVFKALALGANACSIGRPYLYGLAAGGRAGVNRALDLLQSEFSRTLQLAGVSAVAAIRPHHVRRVSG